MVKISNFLLTCLKGIVFTNGCVEANTTGIVADYDHNKPVNLRYLYVQQNHHISFGCPDKILSVVYLTIIAKKLSVRAHLLPLYDRST